MTRTDVHSPTNLVTEDYEFAYAYDAHPESGERQAVRVMLNLLLDEGFRFTPIHGGDSCDHCGARLRYVAVLKHLPTKGLIKVGEDCLSNRFDRATSEFHALRTSARLNREERTRREAFAALCETHPVLAWLTYPEAIYGERITTVCNDGGACFYGAEGNCPGHPDWTDFNTFLSDIHGKALRYGSLSDRQVEAVAKAIVRDTERRDRKAARLAAEEAAKAAGDMEPVPVTDKRIVITGEVFTLKTVEGDYGVQFKMGVKDDRGFKVYGTEPSSISPEVGSRVTFTARVERSRDDEFFGFFSRPTKAAII